VFLICGPQLMVSALAALLARDRQITLAGTAQSVQEAADRLAAIEASVVVLHGIRSPRDAATKLSTLRAAREDIRVLVISSNQNEQTRLACVQAGAVGYVDDNIEAEGFLQAIHRVHSGEVLITQDVLLNLLQRRRRGGPADGDPPMLAPREIEVLQLMVNGLSTDEVAGQLSITVSTLRTHLKKAHEKLGAHSKLEAVLLAIRAGLIHLPEEPG
jgi:DNA-binding NarL/FixJ family response regulator